MLTLDEQQLLLRLARLGLDARVRGQPPPAPLCGGILDEPLGVFVSIHRARELRGCLGRVDAGCGLGRSVLELAAAVSECDPRFPPVGETELAELAIEISVLTDPREVAGIIEVNAGRHGVIVESGSRRGLLLPQVARDHGWDEVTLVEHACLKAGLQRDAWRTGGRLFVFEALVFAECMSGT